MCEVDENYGDILEKRTIPCVSQMCMKCKANSATLIIRAGDAFCRGCFKEYYVHKFRAMLGKNRLIFPGEKVLLAVSGGPASSSMLAQVQQGLSQDVPKKLRFVPGIVYIDEGGATGQSMEARQMAIAQLESIFQGTGFPFHIVHLEQVFGLPGSVLEAASPTPTGTDGSYKSAVHQYIQSGSTGGAGPSEEPVLDAQLGTIETPSSQHSQALERLFSSVRTLTAREDLLMTLRQHLIVHTARTQSYSKVMMGDSCSRLAVKLLSNIALGRGASLATDTGFSDSRHGDIMVVRPMRDYTSKEIAFYNRMFCVTSVFIPSLDTKVPEKASIQHLTESFVTTLQTDFPSTVSTIYRTSEKLQTASVPQDRDAGLTARCLLCLCPLDTTCDKASAFHATLVSEKLSQKLPAEAAPPKQGCSSSMGRQGKDCGALTDGCCSSDRMGHVPELKSLLCYSCRLTIQDTTAVDSLPPYILTEATRRMQRSQMREEIAEFLLEDDDS
ncbi:cytoplasmic tRNA 2-thiolation protein 2 [Brienomyrus brachyistius]|uniref:cytoplasmic tRNA 2-thiolation protein 2 n=1 Tax=Brienomyrus brachyistius TaxID=42636 RepID=UPI0020B34019|nr:cytoplasmic tRNA 2-thiolation protein 2 [Brienomyrus brachyistius]